MLHPQAQAFIDLLQTLHIPPVHTLSAIDARQFYRERRGFSQPEPPVMAKVQDLQVQTAAGPLALRVYWPSPAQFDPPKTNAAIGVQTAPTPALPVLVYFHGGGWTIGDLDTHDTLCRQLANGSGCAVVAVDYRLGPEHRFPAAVDDCLAATYAVKAHAASLGLDPARIAVGGDSAGGNLAAVVALMARDAKDLPLSFQLLIYPATDMRAVAASHTTNGQGYVLTRDSIAYYRRNYIADEADWADWRASPLLHPNLRGLPPALVLVAGYDPLHDEGVAYAQALTLAGNRATLVNFERQIHGFITMGKIIDEANTAVALCAAELARAMFKTD